MPREMAIAFDIVNCVDRIEVGRDLTTLASISAIKSLSSPRLTFRPAGVWCS
jgi:hypothetical protein